MGTRIPPPVQVKIKFTNLNAGDDVGDALENTFTPTQTLNL